MLEKPKCWRISKQRVNDLFSDDEWESVTEIRASVGVEAVVSTVLVRKGVVRKDRSRREGLDHARRSRDGRGTWDRD